MMYVRIESALLPASLDSEQYDILLPIVKTSTTTTTTLEWNGRAYICRTAQIGPTGPFTKPF